MVESPVVDPVVSGLFRIGRTDRVATAGSCFAQHISRMLLECGFNYSVFETFDPGGVGLDENYGVFPARFGNVYTVRQLVQLFDRAYGNFTPVDDAWINRDGYLVDPLRPRIQMTGFESREALTADRARHLQKVREMFETCDVLIYTLGLTEAWLSNVDGTVFPLCPMAISDVPAENYRFHNFGFAEVTADLLAFVERLRSLNSRATLLLTVSPVSLVATYEERHVLVSTIASKSILRASVEEVIRRHPDIAYFPSYEIITGPHSRGKYFESDMREVNREGVDFVMSLFRKHYLDTTAAEPCPSAGLIDEEEARMNEIAGIICDEGGVLE
ncbi:MAG: GSCFA domain-containing protein [Methylocystis sp.]